MKAILLPLLASTAPAGCMPAQQHANDVNAAAAAAADGKVTVGAVRREIRKGMTGGEGAAVPGSPDVAVSNPGGGETAIYDRISTAPACSRSASGPRSSCSAAGGRRGRPRPPGAG